MLYHNHPTLIPDESYIDCPFSIHLATALTTAAATGTQIANTVVPRYFFPARGRRRPHQQDRHDIYMRAAGTAYHARAFQGFSRVI